MSLMPTETRKCVFFIDKGLAKKISNANKDVPGWAHSLSGLGKVEEIIRLKNRDNADKPEEYSRTGEFGQYDIIDGSPCFPEKAAFKNAIVYADSILLEPYNKPEYFRAAYSSLEELTDEYRNRIASFGVEISADAVKKRIYDCVLELKYY